VSHRKIQFRGAESAIGTNTLGDVVRYTTDGREISELWREYQQTLDIFNQHRSAIVNLLTYPVANPIEDVPQGVLADFEESSEFGEPKGFRGELNYFSMGYGFKWYDLALRMTWKFIAESTAAQVDSLHAQALEADNRLVFNQVMRTVFNNANQDTFIRNQGVVVYPFWNANNNGQVPQPYGSQTFSDTHNHYVPSGSATVDSDDVDDLLELITEHGYTAANGSRLVLMVNKQEAKTIRTFRITNSDSYDFIPALNQPAMIVPNTTGLIGTQVAGELEGLPVIGSYGDAIIVQDDYIPAGYMFAFATGGIFNLQNPIGLREHANPALRGLKLLPGNRHGFPLLDSFYQHGFGTGVRQRSAGAVMQITTDPTYQVPAQYQ
jgi:hypothetical protein